MNKLDYYLLLDGLYRVEDQLFTIDDQLRRSTYIQLTNARLRTTSVWGAAVGGLIAIVPTLISAAGDDWKSVSAFIFYVVAGGMIVLWLYQVREARKAEEEIGVRIRDERHDALWEREDYLLEQVAMYGSRARILREAIDELRANGGSGVGSAHDDLGEPLPAPRLEYMFRYAQGRVEEAVRKSQQLVDEKKREKKQHELLSEWASPFLQKAASAQPPPTIGSTPPPALGTPSPPPPDPAR